MFKTTVQRIMRPLGAALVLTLVVAVFALHVASAATTTQPATWPAAPGATTGASFDRQFIDMMVPHHQSAVAMAQVALRRGQHPQIKALARAIVMDQNREIAQMRTWRAQWFGGSTTPGMDAMPALPGLKMTMTGMSMMHDIVTLKTARVFDRAFIDAVMPHHQLAIQAATLELARGSRPQLRNMAVAIIKGQSREEGLMTAYRDLWYGSGKGMMSGM